MVSTYCHRITAELTAKHPKRPSITKDFLLMQSDGQLSNERFNPMLTLVAPSRKFLESSKVNGSVVWHGHLEILDAYVMFHAAVTQAQQERAQRQSER